MWATTFSWSIMLVEWDRIVQVLVYNEERIAKRPSVVSTVVSGHVTEVLRTIVGWTEGQ